MKKAGWLALWLVFSGMAVADDCGRISVFHTPPEAKDLYPVVLLRIDGNNKVHTREIFRVAPGKHVVEMHELISDPMLRRKPTFRQQAKPLVIDVEPGYTYKLAARFIRKNRLDVGKDAGYWEPVVWKVQSQRCAMDKPDVEPVTRP